MVKSPYSLAVVAALLAPTLSSFAWVTEQEAVRVLPIFVVGSFSPLLAGIVLLLFLRLRVGTWQLRLPREVLWEFLLIAILRNGIGFLFFLTALTLTSSIKIMFLTKMEPYLVLFLQWMRGGTTISRRQARLLLVHVGGAIVLSTGGNFSFGLDQFGDFCIVGGLLVNATCYGPAQRLGAKIGSASASAWTQFVPGLLMAPLAIYFYPESFNLNQSEIMTGWEYLLTTVLLFYILSTSLWFYSLQELPGWLCSALRSVGPILAAPVAWIIFGKNLDSTQLLGATIVLITSLMMVFERPSIEKT